MAVTHLVADAGLGFGLEQVIEHALLGVRSQQAGRPTPRPKAPAQAAGLAAELDAAGAAGLAAFGMATTLAELSAAQKAVFSDGQPYYFISQHSIDRPAAHQHALAVRVKLESAFTAARKRLASGSSPAAVALAKPATTKPPAQDPAVAKLAADNARLKAANARLEDERLNKLADAAVRERAVRRAQNGCGSRALAAVAADTQLPQ